MKRRLLAMTMAGVTALTSTSICAFADGQDSKALASAITIAKTRLDIPEELTEFSYNTYDRFEENGYVLTWSTPDGAQEYRSIQAVVKGSLILSYYDSASYKGDGADGLARLSGDELYKKAQEVVSKIDPSVAKVIDIDRGSLDISIYNKRAEFSFVRTKDGVPVENDRGSIVLDKNTGELIAFNMNWHINASFKDKKDAISEAEAKKKYAEMIQLTPQYEFDYDWETKKLTPRLVYRQTDFGEINAFTGKKSNFEADGYYDEMEDSGANDTAEDTGTKGEGGYQFTEQEQAELDKKLPYASKEAVIKLMQADKYMTYSTDIAFVSSELYKFNYGNGDKYYYTASFSTEGDEEYDIPFEEIVEEDGSVSVPAYEPKYTWKTINITVDAESGQVISYSYYDSQDEEKNAYDMGKADKLAEEIAKSYAGDKFGEYSDYSSQSSSWNDGKGNVFYNGSSHGWDRYSNDILVSGDSINVRLNADMKLVGYNYSYTDVKLPDPSGMLSAGKVMEKFWETHDIDMYYLARFIKGKTCTVLVYAADGTVYADAFTGEQVYDWWDYRNEKNDLSGIKDKKILKMAKALDDHGFVISTEKFSEKDTADSVVFEQLMGVSTGEDSKKLTRGDALVIFTKSVAGDKLPELKGIYKSPFSDVKDTDKNVGYYAIAYGMGVVSGDKLNAGSDFTYGDMIKMVYTMYTAG